jgi:acetyl-CoA C-acetyltransferase
MQQTSETNIDYLTPVIVGVGQLLDRPAENEDGLEPLELIIKALEIADEDSCHKFLAKVDYIDIQNITSRSYENIAGMIIKRLNLSPSHCVYHDVSGELPITNLCEAANRIANGTSKVSVICGGESTWSVRRAKNREIVLGSWSGTENSAKSWIPKVKDIVRKYGLHIPVSAYALYENACRSKWQQSVAEGQRESGELQERASEIASSSHFSWTKSRKKLNDIITPSTKNKLIAWPYTQLMVANNNLNSGSAIIITSLGLAKDLGINPKKLIYIHAGGYASEPASILERDNYYHSSAMEAVFDRVFTANKLTMKDIAYTEIYSCFPCVTKLAKRIIHPQLNQDLTVVGGMTFCRGQLSNFMSQAIVEMVRKLRIKGKYGLLYGNGHYLTHAAGVIISTLPPASKLLPINLNLQDIANSRRGKIPDLIEQYEGYGTIETYTVVYDKNSVELFWIIVARTKEKKRFVAITKQNASSDRAPSLNNTRDIIGRHGKSIINDGYNIWIW